MGHRKLKSLRAMQISFGKEGRVYKQGDSKARTMRGVKATAKHYGVKQAFKGRDYAK